MKLNSEMKQKFRENFVLCDKSLRIVRYIIN